MSNARDLRKKVAKEVEAEIFSIQTQLNNMQLSLESMDYKQLKQLSYSNLRSIRSELQNLEYKIKNTNRAIKNISERQWGDKTVELEDGQQVFIDPYTHKKLLPPITEP